MNLKRLLSACFSGHVERVSRNPVIEAPASGIQFSPNYSRIRERLSREFAYLECLDFERSQRGNANFGWATEDRIIWRELFELELQNLDDQIERTCEAIRTAHAAKV